ncbi:MAG: hypothetical protein MGU50_06610 [Trichodesmium sp. MAG_R02]|nr:hypothetical protein [Trichodesmium sp. MAG_R02]MDE5111366.1 hypothetical protein [Trichodesmium sp. St7_bin2_1]
MKTAVKLLVGLWPIILLTAPMRVAIAPNPNSFLNSHLSWRITAANYG